MRGKLLGAGGDGIDTELLTASPDEVLDGQIFYGEGSEEMQTGTMPDRPAVDTAPGIVGLEDLLKVYLYKGGHIREGASGYPEVNIPYPDLVNAINLVAEVIRNGTRIAGVTGTYGHDGNLTPETLVAGKIGYGANGRVAGAAADRGTVNKTLAAGETYNIAKGFYDDGQVKAKDLASQTGGNAGAGDILKNKIAWVNGNKVTGNVESKAGETYHPQKDTDRTIPAARYTTGDQVIKGVKVSGLNAAAIRSNTTVKIGDSTDDDCVASVKGSIADKAGETFHPQLGTDRTIPAERYTTGDQVIKGVQTENISAANIKKGVRMKVGDTDLNIIDVTGTFAGTLRLTGNWYKGTLIDEGQGWQHHSRYVVSQIVNNEDIGPGTATIRIGMYYRYHEGNANKDFTIGFGGYWYVKCFDTSESAPPFIYNNANDITIQIGI